MASQYLDFLGPMQVGANLAATRQNLMLQRERSRLEAQKFLEDTLQARALEDYRNRLLEMQSTSQNRMAEDLALRTRTEQRYAEAQKLTAQRQTQADQKQAMFFRTMAGLAPVLGQRGAAQASAALTGWMPTQIASDLLTSQGTQRPMNLGSRKVIDPMSQQVIAEIPFTSVEERNEYLKTLEQPSGIEYSIVNGKLVPKGGQTSTPTEPQLAHSPTPKRKQTYDDKVRELEQYDAVIKRAKELMNGRPAFAFAYLQKQLGDEKAIEIFEELKNTTE